MTSSPDVLMTFPQTLCDERVLRQQYQIRRCPWAARGIGEPGAVGNVCIQVVIGVGSRPLRGGRAAEGPTEERRILARLRLFTGLARVGGRADGSE